jgi:SP family sugar:H+ symporter-like MFS transporter
MNSLPWIGKIIGCFGAEVVIEKVGFKKSMYIAAIVQIIAVISEFNPVPYDPTL